MSFLHTLHLDFIVLALFLFYFFFLWNCSTFVLFLNHTGLFCQFYFTKLYFYLKKKEANLLQNV